MTTSVIRVGQIIQALYGACDGVIECRAINTSGEKPRVFAHAEDVDTIRDFCQQYRHDHNLYWGVSTRRDDACGTLSNCLCLPALFADLDFKLSSEAAVRTRLNDCPLVPSLVVASGGGLQSYWFLREPADVPTEADRLKDLLRRLAAYLEGDVVSGEPARVLRVPGMLNHKYVPVRSVRVESFDPARRYNPSDFDWLPAVPIRYSSQPIDLSKVIDRDRNITLYKLGRALKGKGLPPLVVATMVRVANTECCATPLEEWEVKQIVHNALSQPDRPLSSAAGDGQIVQPRVVTRG